MVKGAFDYGSVASVGCGAVELESTDFDRGPAGRPGGHHRPDVTFELPAESRELYAYVTDVEGRWARVSTVHVEPQQVAG